MGLFDNPTSMGELTMGNLGNKAKQMGGAIGGITTALSPIKDIPDTKQ
jgi:hypothetical protein